MEETPALRVGGVPEAFNLPFQDASFGGIPVQFVQCGGGSGEMIQKLEQRTIDVAFALTDCIVAAIEKEKNVRIIAPVVVSPLTWAVCTREGLNMTQLQNARWAVSRLGSGSHVMAMVLAKQHDLSTDMQFVVEGSFDRMCDAVKAQRADAFLWEIFTTTPLLQNEPIDIVDKVQTPWPSFSAAVASDCQRMEDVRAVVRSFLQQAHIFKNDASSVQRICTQYGMTEKSAARWLAEVEYATPGDFCVPLQVLEQTRTLLREAGVIERSKEFVDISAYSV